MRTLGLRTVAVVAALALLGAGCGRLSEKEVALVGNSLLDEARDEVLASVRGDVTIFAFPGVTMGGAAQNIQTAVAAEPDVLVIELGTNDALQRIDYVVPARTTLDMAADVPCVIWVQTAVDNEVGDALRIYLEEQARLRPNLRLVPWDELAANRPEWYVSDGIHHTAAGQEAFAEAIGEAVEDCP